ncbi:MAG: alpha/beta fold hydrolase [Steroidobacteraceae bacterium]
MSDVATDLTRDDPEESRSEPLYFSSGGHELFGWLHRPAPARPSQVGLVICKSFGYEVLCAHRSVRAFAEVAAEQGIPALRFDYQGCGDSADIDPGADQVAVWVENILTAVAELRRLTGVAQVCLLGVRFGALLATLAAARRADVRGLLLLAPVISGKRYLRDLQITRLAARIGLDTAETTHGQPDIEASTPGSLEFSGYAMSAASIESLSKLDLAKLPAPLVSQALVIDRDDLPAARSWCDGLIAAGVPTQYLPLPGFVQMALVAPQFALVPTVITAAIGSWLKFFAVNLNSGSDCVIPAAQPAAGAASLSLQLPGSDSGEDGPSECPISFGRDAALFGIVTQPCRQEARRRGVILLNAGADYHIGPSRLYVSLARKWARSGYYVLRMDLAGLGDSNTRSDRADNVTFPPDALTDIRDAVSYLRQRYDIREVTLTGLCSGAYHALRAAAEGVPVERVLLVNPQNYFWTEDMTLNDVQLAEVVRNPGVYRERIQSANAWRRLLSGQVNVWRIFKIYAYRQKFGVEVAWRNMARSLRIRLQNDLGRELENIVGRGVQVTFVFASGEPGIDLLRMQGGSAVKKLGDNCRVRIIEDADHTFSRSGPRSAMEGVLSDELHFARRVPMPASSEGISDDPPVKKQKGLA